MASTFGTLRKDSYFTPGEVLDEATQLNNAIRALAQIQFNNADSALVTQDSLASWNAFVASWNSFWDQCNGSWLAADPTGWIFRAKDATRDELLDFETQYAQWKATIGGFGAAAPLPDPTPESDRTPDNVAAAIDDAGAAADEAAKKGGQAARDFIATAWPVIVLVVVVGGVYVFRKPLGALFGKAAAA